MADAPPDPLPTATHADVAAEPTWSADGSTPTGSWIDPAEPMPTAFGRYRVVRRLGHGGMGTVYEALDPDLNRRVAVKVPYLDRHSERADTRVRFLREARAAAAVQHPNVCPIFDTGVQDGVPFAVMTLIPGGSLADLLPLGEFRDPRRAVAFISRVADGLAAIHTCGIVHRDLKPANILIDPSPAGAVPKITDFGLARVADSAGGLTRSGGILGTPAYMAPEQAVGDLAAIGPATDVYALGTVLYQMLTGRTPFDGSALAILASLRDRPPPSLAGLRPDLDAGLVRVVERAMAKKPEQRYATAALFAEVLQVWLGTPATPSPDIVARWNPKWRRYLGGVLAIVLLLLGVGFAAWNEAADRGPPVPTLVPEPPKAGSDTAQTEPRVRITYDVERQGVVRRVEMPFVIAVIADLSGTPVDAKVKDASDSRRLIFRRFVSVDLASFNSLFHNIAPRLVYRTPDPDSNEGTSIDVDLGFRHIDHFSPEVVVAGVPVLKSMLEERKSRPAAELAEFDARLSARLAAVMHHPEFRRLEAAWRGFHYLTAMTAVSDTLKLRVLNASKSELVKDTERATEIEQTVLYKKLHTEEFDQLGGTPAGLLVGDFEIDLKSKVDVVFLHKLGEIAAAAQCPIVAGASIKSFGMVASSELLRPRDMRKVFNSIEYEPLHTFRQSAEAPFAALALPRLLLRLQYSRDTRTAESFNFEEPFDLQEKALWGTTAWVPAVAVGDAMRRSGWPAQICRRDGGGLVGSLPEANHRAREGDSIAFGPVDVTLTLPREKELTDLGFVSVLPDRVGRSMVVLPSMSSCAYGATADLPARLNVLLCAARFAHALRIMARDVIPTSRGPDKFQWMTQWLANYVLPPGTTATVAEQAARPLSEGRVEVVRSASQPTMADITLVVRPHWQFNELPGPVRLPIGRYPWEQLK